MIPGQQGPVRPKNHRPIVPRDRWSDVPTLLRSISLVDQRTHSSAHQRTAGTQDSQKPGPEVHDPVVAAVTCSMATWLSRSPATAFRRSGGASERSFAAPRKRCRNGPGRWRSCAPALSRSGRILEQDNADARQRETPGPPDRRSHEKPERQDDDAVDRGRGGPLHPRCIGSRQPDRTGAALRRNDALMAHWIGKRMDQRINVP